MANCFQKLIYNLSAVSPLCFIFSITWYIKNGTILIPIICILTGTLLIVCLGLSFSYGKKNVASIDIRVAGISPNDGWLVAYIISYMFPFASMAIENFHIVICVAVSGLLIIILPWINSAIPNPLLFFLKYHFYQVEMKTGMSGYVLISKRKLRKAKDIKTVKRMFEFLLIDAEGR